MLLFFPVRTSRIVFSRLVLVAFFFGYSGSARFLSFLDVVYPFPLKTGRTFFMRTDGPTIPEPSFPDGEYLIRRLPRVWFLLRANLFLSEPPDLRNFFLCFPCVWASPGFFFSRENTHFFWWHAVEIPPVWARFFLWWLFSGPPIFPSRSFFFVSTTQLLLQLRLALFPHFLSATTYLWLLSFFSITRLSRWRPAYFRERIPLLSVCFPPFFPAIHFRMTASGASSHVRVLTALQHGTFISILSRRVQSFSPSGVIFLAHETYFGYVSPPFLTGSNFLLYPFPSRSSDKGPPPLDRQIEYCAAFSFFTSAKLFLMSPISPSFKDYFVLPMR